ncbi:Oxysterol-binding protein-related protein 1C [Nymphaea thermarum]|nr:Oxysterol-binding protein-related protein 1C [Nymphaea thermarum]
MHPFCCVSSCPDGQRNSVTDILEMPAKADAGGERGTVSREASQSPSISCAAAAGEIGNGLRMSSTSDHGRLRLADFSIRGSVQENSDHRELKLNNIVGNGISGILQKWVNYGKGWRPRWFVLQDGVVSYYKIHGPDKIQVNQETVKGSKVIGEESQRWMCKQKNGNNHHHHHHQNNHSQNGDWQSRRKPIGEIHLKCSYPSVKPMSFHQVSSIRESKSDDKRFSIFTGTKRLHLRAETREDRATWVEALLAVKEMFPRVSNSELMASMDGIAVSTDNLRQRLQEEGVNDTAITDCEQIMRTEFSTLQNQLIFLQQKSSLLLDTLRQLEDLTVDVFSEGSVTESDDDNERQDAAEEETDEEDSAFFDTRDFLSSSSFKSNGSDLRRSSFDSDEDEICPVDCDDHVDASMHSVGFNYPYVRRRKKLPDPIEKEKGVSLWSIIKDNIGKDLTKVCLPVYFNEPLSSLQKCFEDLEYSYLIDRAYEWGKRGNNLMRILNVAAFAVSGYASTEGRNCKPFNPLLGETYEADYPDKGLRFFSEKVSHHPMIVACHCEGQGWKFRGDSNLKSKFWGRSIQLDPVGVLTLEFDDGEVFQWSKVTTSIYNLILGKLYCDHYGTMRIQGNQEYSCKLKFKEQSIIDRNPHQVQGIVQDRHGKTVATLFGKWDESMHYVKGDCSGKDKDAFSEAHLLWRRNNSAKFPTRYNLTRFAITTNELTPGLKEKLPLTDSRLRPDQRCLENGEYELANAEKLRLEQRQRQARKMQERGWKPRWFAKDKGSDTYRYVGGYWEARESGRWESCPDIFGQVVVDQQLLD